MNKAKRILSLALCLVMMLTLMPFSVFAADEGTHSIVIKYVYKDGTEARSQYTATVEYGSSFNVSVKNPVIQGYQVDTSQSSGPASVSVNADTVNFALSNITSDVTVKVVYIPARVKYTVNFYQQNVDNDGYTLADREELSGYTGSYIQYFYAQDEHDDPSRQKARSYTGFTTLPFNDNDEDAIIAADGTTVVDIYYDRDYYLVKFNLGEGGYGVDPVYGRYGDTFSVGTPVRPGYTFAGWDKTVDTTITGNATYTAKWTAKDVNYTVVYWQENANDDGYSYWETATKTALADTTVSGADDKSAPGFKYNDTSTNKNVTVKGDGSTIVNVYYDRQEYTLTFKTARGYTLNCEEKTEHIHDGTCSPEPNHVHTRACYGAQDAGNLGQGDIDKIIKDCDDAGYPLVSGTIFRLVYYGNRYVLYFDGNWYDYGKDNFTTAQLYKDGNTYKIVAEYMGNEIKIQSGIFTHSTYAYEGRPTCKCSKTEHLHTEACYKGSDPTTAGTITAKYGQDIRDKFPIPEYEGFWWKVPSNNVGLGEGKYIVSLDTMPAQDLTFTGHYEGRNANLTYYVECLPGETADKSMDGKYFKLYKNRTTKKDGSLTKAEEFHDIIGFKQYKSDPSFNGNSVSPNRNNYFYYTRNSYNLTYYNFNTQLSNPPDVKYQAPLASSYNIKPPYPTGVEAGMYEFKGWYYTEGCYDGTEVHWDSDTMPANDVMLYAKWVPVSHSVKFYTTEADAKANTNCLSNQSVSHGSAPAAVENPTYNDLDFVGWFYRDENGNEKAIDIASARVSKDMVIYAKWNSKVMVQYTVRYLLKDSEVPVAAEKTGYTLGGTNKTFEAKVGDELYAYYQNGYYPVVRSSSLQVMPGVANELTFEYIEAPNVPYTVKYVDNEGRELATAKIVDDNNASVVTEKAATIENYIPDAATKRLILAVPEGRAPVPSDNILYFIYTYDVENALVTVTHWKQLADGTYEEYQSNSYTAAKNSPAAADPINIPGYTYNSAKSNESGTVDDNGLELNLYYDENSVTINYVAEDNGSVTPVSESVKVISGSAKGSVANPANGYRVLGWFDGSGNKINSGVVIRNDGSYAFVPAKTGDRYQTATYTAKFVKNEVVNKTAVVDYGIPADIDIGVSVTGVSKNAPSSGDVLVTYNDYTDNEISTDNANISASGDAIRYTLKGILNSTETFYYSAQAEEGFYRHASVTVVPATTVYYEDSIGSITYIDGVAASGDSGKWSIDGTDLSKNAVQSIANEVYGYDAEYANFTTYSMGSAHKVTVSAKNNPNSTYSGGEGCSWPTASFSFHGTGFDIISVTDTDAGLVKVTVSGNTDAGKAYNRSFVVNEYYGYKCTQNQAAPYLVYVWEYIEGRGWHVMHHENANETLHNAIPATEAQLQTYIDQYGANRKANPENGDTFVTYEKNYTWENVNSGALYQIPVMKITGLEPGTYTVTITPTFGSNYDMNKDGHYSFCLDAIRVYEPVGSSHSAYAEAEKAPQYIALRSYLIGQNAFKNDETTITGIAFIDGYTLDETIADYADYNEFGPNNEIYLKPDKAISFKFDMSNVKSVQLGCKTISRDGEAQVCVNSESNVIKTKTATDMFYDITNYIDKDGLITITNNGSDVISLTTLKVTYISDSSTKGDPSVDEGTVRQAKALVRSIMLAAVPVEVIPFEPVVSVDVQETATVGDEVTVKVTTSDDVAYITVNGDVVDAHDGNYVWTYTMAAENEGDMAVEVVAYNAEGEAAENVMTANVAVEAAPVVPDEPDTPDQPDQPEKTPVIVKVLTAIKNFFSKLFG